jgi:hypothetical protein
MTATGPAHDTNPRKLTFTVPGDGEDVPAVAWLPARPPRSGRWCCSGTAAACTVST